MNRKGFTLVELLATIVILGIVVGFAVVSINGIFGNTKKKTEGVFVKAIEDALNIYLDSDARGLKFSDTEVCTIAKKHGNVKVYKSSDNLSLKNIITPKSVATNDTEKRLNSTYSPLTESDIVNPANETVKCNLNAPVSIYRDSDYVYYYKINKSDLNCLINSGTIDSLPSSCAG